MFKYQIVLTLFLGLGYKIMSQVKSVYIKSKLSDVRISALFAKIHEKEILRAHCDIYSSLLLCISFSLA